MQKAFVGHKCVFYVKVETSWFRVIPSRKETTPEFSGLSSRNDISGNPRTLQQIVAFN